MLDADNAVFGSDEEKAIVSAIRSVFHHSDHVYCVRHIQENVVRHLTDKGVDVGVRQQVLAMLRRCDEVDAESSVACDTAVADLMQFVCLHLPDHSDYFRKHVINKVENNIKVLAKNSWIGRGWKNNNAESYNHVLRSKTEWRSMKRVYDLMDSLHSLVKLQMKDMRRALHGEGCYTLTSVFTRHYVTYQAWLAMSDARKNAVFERYLSDSGNRQLPKTVQSTDGNVTVVNVAKVARKPGQRKRPRSTRTKTTS